MNALIRRAAEDRAQWLASSLHGSINEERLVHGHVFSRGLLAPGAVS